MDASRIKVVLQHPQSAENVGAVARALKNFGLERLAVVAPAAWGGAPRSGGPWTAGEDVMARARRTARKASDLLDAAEIHVDLPAALGPATWTCGTTSRELEGRPRLDPRTLGAEVARRAAAGEVALVFGEERRGLSDAELELCQAVCTIPTAAAYDSMNLAQAVAVIAYEVRMADPGAALAAAAPVGEPARHATIEALWARTSALLGRAGYLNPQNPEHILADFRRLLARAEPTQREVELLVAAIRALERRLPTVGDR
ncbi:RNA methyltransferase [Anaeromyxobacter oryzisoli]|uniref:RNA methyltransferase n=1 Tax=Anaeromyxobacter oryzisoli TaxID=2925408 RepID=UPI001F58432D|nr:TrmH family RNA methyltransferase [Anaeromyxobacter sp. SG63]